MLPPWPPSRRRGWRRAGEGETIWGGVGHEEEERYASACMKRLQAFALAPVRRRRSSKMGRSQPGE
jgi:hypothetical protein